MTPGELIERLSAETRVDEFLALVHPDAEYQPFADAPVYEGLAAIRTWAEGQAADPARPQATPLAVTESADRAVVHGQVAFQRITPKLRYTERQVMAWVVTVADGKIRRVQAFSSWRAADDAAAFSDRETVRTHRLRGAGLMFLRRLLRPLPLSPA